MSTQSRYRIAHARAKRRFMIRRALSRLQAEGYVRCHGAKLEISKSGMDLLTHRIRVVRNKLQLATWDNKWRVVIFDIPKVHTSLRDQVRGILKRAGFKMLQQSVWVFPHDCAEIVELITSDQRVRGKVLYGVLETIGGDAAMRREFGLGH